MSSEWVLTTPPPPATKRLRYGENENHFGDLWLPPQARSQNIPLIINIHGGFWRARYDLLHAGHLCHALSQLGYGVWNIEYRRLGNGGGYPETFNDVSAAINFVSTFAATYQFDLKRMIIMGHSAGGHLASWTGSHQTLAPLKINPKAVIPLAGVVDLRRAYELGLSETVVKEFLGGSPNEVPTRYAETSPIELTPNTKQILLHGQQDDIVPCELSQSYGVKHSAELHIFKEAGHFEVIDPKSVAFEKLRTVLEKLQI